jgi:hypothetical protein
MSKFEEFFIFKYAPSFPGPKVDENYCGLSTSDSTLFVNYKGIWYRPMEKSALRLKTMIETSCENSEDVDTLVRNWIDTKFFEEV